MNTPIIGTMKLDEENEEISAYWYFITWTALTKSLKNMFWPKNTQRVTVFRWIQQINWQQNDKFPKYFKNKLNLYFSNKKYLLLIKNLKYELMKH